MEASEKTIAYIQNENCTYGNGCGCCEVEFIWEGGRFEAAYEEDGYLTIEHFKAYQEKLERQLELVKKILAK